MERLLMETGAGEGKRDEDEVVESHSEAKKRKLDKETTGYGMRALPYPVPMGPERK